MQYSNGDPLDWTVDEVVEFLCHNPESPWSNSNSSIPRPNPDLFEAALRDNYITGEVLLQDVDKQALRDDLGLKALGHRSSIMLAIRFLQQGSSKFQASKPGQTFLLPSPSPMQPPPHYQHPNAYPSPVQNSYQAPSTSPRTPLLNRPLTTAAISDTPTARNGADNVDHIAQNGLEGVHALGESSEKPEFNSSRPHEQTVVDKYGNKRRRLNLGSFVESRSNDPMSDVSGDRKTKGWYMGPDVLTPDQVFYSTDPEGDDQTFTLVSCKLPTAQRTFVNQRLRYFFQQSPIQLSSAQNSSQRAVVPYNPLMVKSSSDRFFTLYTSKRDSVNATKERINDWPQLAHQLKLKDKSQPSIEPLKPSDPFSHLLQKYPVEEDFADAFPLYGDSGSEGEFDEETWREMEEEQSGPNPPESKKLGPTEVEFVISDCISEYEKTWHEFRLPKEEYKARNLWLAARRGNRVNQETKAIAKDIALLGIRLQKLQDEIRKNEYAKQVELRTQCQCLENTVFNIQKQKWRVSVLEQEKCPPKVSAPPRPQYPPKSKVGDEESLESESDFNENDSLDGFIIVDDIGTIEPLQAEGPPASTSSSDGDDDIISVSGTRRRTRGRVPRVFASSSPSPSPSPARTRPIREKPDVIDLTMGTPEPEDFRIETPPLNPVGTARSNFSDSLSLGIDTSMSPPPSLGSTEGCVQVKRENRKCSSLPNIDDIDGILSLDWGLLEARRDRRRLLAKLIGGLADDERNNLAKHIPTYQFSQLKRQTCRALRCLAKGLVKIPKMDPFEDRLIMRTASFYVAWLSCVRLGLGGISKKYVDMALNELEDKVGREFDAYYEELIERLRCSRGWERGTEHDPEPEDTPHKKRKRDVKESQSAKMNQASAQLRVAQQEKQKQKLEKSLKSMGLSNDNPSHQAVSFKDPVIYLNPHIGQRVKPHQLNGIRFMWRELIEDKNQQGCLLAHSMGLGKTMQVISLLTTISEAAASDDPKVRRQVPEAFRRTQALILCPSSLIENWHDEFLMWSPRISPMVRRVISSDGLEARLLELSTWHQEGGVLLISYNIFQAWIFNKDSTKRARPLSDANHEKVRRWLLEGPNIIIADEAHKMKNPGSATSMAAMQFRSRSRIALTGSPLSNNLGDYYTMVNWIADDYLGSSVEFKAHYIEPIEQGLYADSTYGERRRSLMRLQVLKQILEPKITRADVTVLEGDLPPKVEFVLTVPLTKLQKAAYDCYAAFVLQGRMEEVAQTQLWSWLAILGLCSNHPACFWEKLMSQAQDAAKKMSDRNQEIAGDEPIEKVGLPELGPLILEQNHIFAQIPNLKAIELSARAEIAHRIIDESIRVGDKVLLFSQSLPTLDYLEYLLKDSNWKYSRLDGQTPIATRQAATKQFNQGDQKQVYLISTRAGGLGLNIPGANRVIIFDFSFSPTWEEQAVGRAYRLGQQKPVFVYRFIAGGTFEEIIHHKAIFKTQLAVRVVDKKNPIRVAHKKPGDYLFPAKPVAQQDISGYIGKDKQVLDKILLEDKDKRTEDRLIRDITLTETFQTEDNDKLTDEEKRSVQEAFDDETIRRTDPAAYYKRITDRQAKQMQQQYVSSFTPFQTSGAHGVHQPSIPQSAPNRAPPTSRPGVSMHQAQRQEAFQPQVPHRAHNGGPPALEPDMITYQPPSSNPGLSVGSAFLPLARAPIQQPPRSERADGQNKAIHPPNAKFPHQQTASVGHKSAPVETRAPGRASPKTVSLNTVSRPQASSSRTGSEPPKPDSPGVNASRHELVGEQQGTSPRGQSAPLQLKESLSQAPGHNLEHAPEPSATTKQLTASGGQTHSGSDREQPASSCRQQ
ncbi:P-loop containing nucleoside triphosphate hydrolase protein [Aspergillus varians]